MFTAFMNLIIFSLFYLLYRYVKSRIYEYLDKEPVSAHREWLILPVALFMFAFVATSGFTRYNVSSDSISIPFALHPFHIIPFKEIYLNWQNYVFYNDIYGQTTTFYDDIFIYQMKDYIRLFTSMLALGFTVSIVNKTFLKSLLFMMFIRLLLGFMIGESYIATSLCLALIAFLIAFAVYKLMYRGLIRKNFMETIANSTTHRAFVIGYLLVISLLPLYFVQMDNRWAPDRWATEQFIELQNPIVLQTNTEDFELSANAFQITNKDSIEIEFSMSQIPKLEIPYHTTFNSIETKFDLGDSPAQLGTNISSEANSFLIRFDNVSYAFGGHQNQSIFPIKFYGISAFTYTIDDTRFRNQLKVLDSNWWTSEDGYDCYTYTYQVPKVESYEVNVGSTITFDTPNPNKDFQTFENKAWATSTYAVKIDSNETFDIYSVDNYFYDYEMGPLEKSQIQGLEQNFYMATVRVDINNDSKEPIWTIDSIDYFKPYLE